MRSILNRLAAATTANAKKDEAKPLKFGQEAKTTLQEMRALRAAGVVSKKTEPVSGKSFDTRSIPISDVTGSRGLVSQEKGTAGGSGSAQGASGAKEPYIPITVVTGSRDITTVSPELRTYLRQGSPSATAAIPKEYAELANLLEKAAPVIDFEDWANMTAKQQLTATQKAGLSLEDQRELLNTKPHYVETIAKIQGLFANRYVLGLTIADARNAAKELFTIANEREEAITRTGKYENDAVFAPRVLRWLDEQEKEILDNLTKKASETDRDTEYTGGNPDLAERAARRASYAEIDDAAATQQIEALILKNIEEAKRLAALSGQVVSKLPPVAALMQWFYNNVKKNAPMDYKNQIIWQKVLPGLPYPEEDQIYNVFGIDISSSDLGNLNYAMVGKALGIPETLLLQQAGAAQLRDHGEWDFIGSELESIRQKDAGYGDQDQDQGMIKMGFDIYSLLD